MKQEILLAASFSTWPEIKELLSKAVVSGREPAQAPLKGVKAHALYFVCLHHKLSDSVTFAIVPELHEKFWVFYWSKKRIGLMWFAHQGHRSQRSDIY